MSQSERERGRMRVAEGDSDDSSSCTHDAAALTEELHLRGEEERLDEWILLELGLRDGRLQQLPRRLRRAVRVDQHERLREEIEIIVPSQYPHRHQSINQSISQFIDHWQSTSCEQQLFFQVAIRTRSQAVAGIAVRIAYCLTVSRLSSN